MIPKKKGFCFVKAETFFDRFNAVLASIEAIYDQVQLLSLFLKARRTENPYTIHSRKYSALSHNRA